MVMGCSLQPNWCSSPNHLLIINHELSEFYVERILKQWPDMGESNPCRQPLSTMGGSGDTRAKPLPSLTTFALLWKQRRVIYPTHMYHKSRII